MPVCSFCKKSYEFPRGTTVVQKDGNIRYYCTSKCKKNSEMGRDSKKVKWVRKSDIVKEDKAKKAVVRQKVLDERKMQFEAKKAKEEVRAISKRAKLEVKKASKK